MYLIVGLGNPGTKYDQTRHNIGFNVVDKIAAIHNIKLNKEKFSAIIGEGSIVGEKVILAMPLTYMNLSGQSVQPLSAFYKIPPEKIIVIYDDIDLDVGKIRTKPSGSAGGHNGMKSIIGSIGIDKFPRIRVGVGKKPENWDLGDYVLSRFSKEERAEIEKTISTVCEIVEIIIKDGIDKAMNLHN